MKSGDYVCVSIPYLRKKFIGIPIIVPNVIGYGIRLFTWSRYDHSFIYIGNNLIVEAQPSGAIISSLDKYAAYHKVVCNDELTDEQRAGICKTAIKLVGRPYGFLDIVYLALATLGLKSDYILNQVRREDRLICSQLVAISGILNGVNWSCGKPNPCLVTPADLAERIR